MRLKVGREIKNPPIRCLDENRKRGYGTAILHKAVVVAKENNCYKVVLLTGRKEESVLRFYERQVLRRE